MTKVMLFWWNVVFLQRNNYMVKNSWGKTGDYQGIWYMSKAYIALNTTYIFLNKAAVKDICKKLGF